MKCVKCTQFDEKKLFYLQQGRIRPDFIQQGSGINRNQKPWHQV